MKTLPSILLWVLATGFISAQEEPVEKIAQGELPSLLAI